MAQAMKPVNGIKQGESMCDMCSSPEAVYRIELEGSVMNVCEKCASFGRIISKIQQEEPVMPKKKQKQEGVSGFIREEYAEKKPPKETETVQVIVSNYAALIKNAREKLGLKQEELAKKVAEKKGSIHKLESGRMKPSLAQARKLEKFLKISLVEAVELGDSDANPIKAGDSSEGLTIGDMIKKK